MYYLKRLLCFLFIIATVSACDNDVDVNASWEETTFVYGLLDIHDSVHYVKVNKAFLNNDKDAEQVAKNNPDSIYHTQDIRVILQELKNGSVSNEITLQKDTLRTKEEGLFPSPKHILYKTPPYQLNANRQYQIRVEKLKQKEPVYATTPIVDDIVLNYPTKRNQLSFGEVEELEFNWSTGQNAYFYNLQIDIFYVNKNTRTGNFNKDTIHWTVFRQQTTSSTAGGSDFEYEIPSTEFYQRLASGLDRKNDIVRPVDSMSAKVKVTGGAREIFNYMRVNEPSISIVQKNPEYTNINNGRGIFSSRNTFSYDIGFSSGTRDSLVNGRFTRDLQFVD